MSLRDPEVYDNPDSFDPERYYSGDAEEKGAKNFLVFGTGPHYCIGQNYAQYNLALCIGKASMLLDWKHHPTPKSEEIKVFATIFPMVRYPPHGSATGLLECSIKKLHECNINFFFRMIVRSRLRRGRASVGISEGKEEH